MANKRLIDANEALRMIDNSRTDNPYFNGNTDIIWEKAHDCAISCVMTCPTVDAVEVVRCKDCNACPSFDGNGIGYCWEHGNYILENDFCSYGERRNDV